MLRARGAELLCAVLQNFGRDGIRTRDLFLTRGQSQRCEGNVIPLDHTPQLRSRSDNTIKNDQRLPAHLKTTVGLTALPWNLFCAGKKFAPNLVRTGDLKNDHLLLIKQSASVLRSSN